jgi:hypothetical protein
MNPDKKNFVRCIKCNYFDAARDCAHCQKCLGHELAEMIASANIEILKIGSAKKLMADQN